MLELLHGEPNDVHFKVAVVGTAVPITEVRAVLGTDPRLTFKARQVGDGWVATIAALPPVIPIGVTELQIEVVIANKLFVPVKRPVAVMKDIEVTAAFQQAAPEVERTVAPPPPPPVPEIVADVPPPSPEPEPVPEQVVQPVPTPEPVVVEVPVVAEPVKSESKSSFFKSVIGAVDTEKVEVQAKEVANEAAADVPPPPVDRGEAIRNIIASGIAEIVAEVPKVSVGPIKVDLRSIAESAPPPATNPKKPTRMPVAETKHKGPPFKITRGKIVSL